MSNDQSRHQITGPPPGLVPKVLPLRSITDLSPDDLAIQNAVTAESRPQSGPVTSLNHGAHGEPKARVVVDFSTC